jgi:YidC/Oxa1 family membrane protein insertase
MRKTLLPIAILSLLAVSWAGALAAPQPIEIEWLTGEGGRVLQVTTSLVRYRIAEQGGVLQSAYVHFSSYRSQTIDAVPGWKAERGKLSLLPAVSLPFEVWLEGEKSDPAVYRGEVSTEGDERATATMRAERSGATIEKVLRFDTKSLYTTEFEFHISGASGPVRVVLGYWPSGKDAPDLVYLYDGKVSPSQLAGGYKEFQGAGLVSRFSVFFLKLLPGQQGVKPFTDANASGQPVFGLEIQPQGGEAVVRGVLYAGRNRYLLLEKAGLESLVSLNLFSRFLVWVMEFFEWLYRVTGNYGWAIILFTLITRAALYPLMRNQLRSMTKMQRLAPKIKKLQERYKDDRETLQKQMMELYRQEKINPMGGCLPMLLQFPILILLWQAILYSAEQIHLSPGFLWVSDLSQPDPYYILVILTTGTMILQQWLAQKQMPSQATGGSQAMMWLFPVIMAVLFLNFPAGLWLYYFLTTLFQMGQQIIINWEMSREAPAPRPAADGEETDAD